MIKSKKPSKGLTSKMSSSLIKDEEFKRYFDDVETSYNQNPTQGSDEEQKKKEGFSSIYLCPLDHSGAISYLKVWRAKDSQYPPIVLIHELGSSINAYKELALNLKESGFDVFCVDMRSHGYSSSTGIDRIDSFFQLVSDLLQVVAWSRYKTGGKNRPIILADGFSALISIYFAKLYPSYCSRLILSTPVMEFPISISRSRRIGIKILSKFKPLMLAEHSVFTRKILTQLQNTLNIIPSGPEGSQVVNSSRTFSAFSVKFLDDLIEATIGSFETFQGIREDVLILNPKSDRLNDISIFMQEEHLDKSKLTVKEFNFEYSLSSKSHISDISETILHWVKGKTR